jgi:hypothetical protein
MFDKTIKLPCYGIVVTFAVGESGELCSDLSREIDNGIDGHAPADDMYNGGLDGIESMILAHAIAGVDIESPAYLEGIETAVEAVSNNT